MEILKILWKTLIMNPINYHSISKPSMNTLLTQCENHQVSQRKEKMQIRLFNYYHVRHITLILLVDISCIWWCNGIFLYILYLWGGYHLYEKVLLTIEHLPLFSFYSSNCEKMWGSLEGPFCPYKSAGRAVSSSSCNFSCITLNCVKYFKYKLWEKWKKPQIKYQVSSRVTCWLSYSVRMRPFDGLAKL